ncbi:hypothetical protein V8J82_06560 [Gymnodinialimonas sp. 2305UL16-5]|uniref:hypothetical protein n=1 Tax=Gymnodinialimonas mytili TaxID=3126503 RepID=UPI0030B176D5
MIDFSPAIWDAAFLYRLSLAGAPPIRYQALATELAHASRQTPPNAGHAVRMVLATATLLERSHGLDRGTVVALLHRALQSAGPAPFGSGCTDLLWNAGRSDLMGVLVANDRTVTRRAVMGQTV